MPKVAVIHTSFVFVSVEPVINELLAELLPDCKVLHFVDSDVLATVVREESISAGSEARIGFLTQAAQAAGADIIFSACSSLGPALDVAGRSVHIPIVKIDEAMARKAAEEGRRIGVLATVATTLAPTSDLIIAMAVQLGREVIIDHGLCAGAFDALMTGDHEKHDKLVLEEARLLAKSVDIIVLAQASMSRLADPLREEVRVPVLASPRMGVEYLAQRVAQLSALKK